MQQNRTFSGVGVKQTPVLPMSCMLSSSAPTESRDENLARGGGGEAAMGRTKLRGLEIAGVKLAIEVPSNFDWTWPDATTESLSCSPVEPDVHIGVRIGATQAPSGDTFLYESNGAQFEIGWQDESWIVAIHGSRRCERTARFDSDFRFGEIVISPEFARESQYPLERPLDELILLHRLIRDGCMVLHGSVSVRGGQALVFLESADASGHSESRESGGHRGRGYVVLRPVLEARSEHSHGVWVHSTPWSGQSGQASFLRAPLAAIHILGPGATPFERLSGRAAQNEILQHAFAPVHDPEAAERLFEIIGQVTRKTSVIRMSQPELRRNHSVNWDAPASGMGFASPSF
jgi:hypothetical protein